MRVSIIRDNATVTVDGVCYAVDVSELPSYFHAIQWDGSKGHIEFGLDAEGRHLPNLSLIDFKPYDFLVDRWNMENAKAAAERELQKRRQKKFEEDEALAAVQAEKDQETRLREAAEKGV